MNMQSLMAQAQKMQRDMEKKKNEIEGKKFEGKSEWVKVELNGKREVLSIKIDVEETLDKDDVEALEDMLKIAINEAVEEIEEEYEDKLGSMASGIPGF